MSLVGRIGVDESGKGDYFGPLVIAACYVAPWHEALLDGVMDSKKLTDKKALALAGVIKQHCPHSVIAVGPERYNEMHAKMKNLNRMLEWGHAKAIENVLALEGVETKEVISDQFANPAGLMRVLKTKGMDVQLESRVRAESDLAVAAASVLARAAFLRSLEKLGDDLGVPLLKGAGPGVDQLARNLVSQRGEEVLRSVAKTHFKTTEKVLGHPLSPLA
jgi:ribonuclease HIII